MKQRFAVDIISGVLIILFLYAALSKLVDIHNFQETLQKGPGMTTMGSAIAWMIPVAELLLVIFLFFPGFRLAGLFGSLFLLFAFTFYLVFMIGISRRPAICGCGGLISILTWPQHIFLNIAFIILTVAAIVLYQPFNILLQQPGSKLKSCLKE